MGGSCSSYVFPFFFILSDTATDDMSQRAEISNVFSGEAVEMFTHTHTHTVKSLSSNWCTCSEYAMEALEVVVVLFLSHSGEICSFQQQVCKNEK